jgi:hypothetical protein
MIVRLLRVDVTLLGNRSLPWDSAARIERTSDKMTRPGLRTMRPTRAAGPVLDLAERPFVGETHSIPPGTSRIAVCGEKRPQGAFDTVIQPATGTKRPRD